MKIAVGSDGFGFRLKCVVKRHLEAVGYHVTDLGAADSADQTPYYETASHVAEQVATGQCDRAVLICGTGKAMAIIANKHPGVTATACDSPFDAAKTRNDANANILTLGALATRDLAACNIVDTWLGISLCEQGEDLDNWLNDSLDELSSVEEKALKAAS